MKNIHDLGKPLSLYRNTPCMPFKSFRHTSASCIFVIKLNWLCKLKFSQFFNQVQKAWKFGQILLMCRCECRSAVCEEGSVRWCVGVWEEAGYRVTPHLYVMTDRRSLIHHRYLFVHLNTNRVAQHFVKVWVVGWGAVEELSPQQLSVQRERRITFLYLAIIYCALLAYGT